jgi:hypothetical protein
MSKVSDGRSVRVGLVGPKPRLRSVGDGQTVNIPLPVMGVYIRSRKAQLSQWMTVQVVNNHDAGRKPGVRGTEIQEKMCTIEIAARTTNRHR